MPNILITNDDGVRAPGLLALKQALDELGTVYVLAPERNWSAAGHARTMHDPLRMSTLRLEDGSQAYATTGGPADCVALALLGALDVEIDLVVSGINNGHNMGNDVNYSGTVACAREATIFGIPGIAVSTALEPLARCDLADARRLAGTVAAMVTAQVFEHGLPKGTMLNVNVPAVPAAQLRGVEVTRLGVRTYADELMRREDPYGRPYYWIYGALPTDVADDGTDVGAVANDMVSITPIGLDMTEHGVLESLRRWTFDTLHVRAVASAPEAVSTQVATAE
jgi:5'-nucleotidase